MSKPVFIAALDLGSNSFRCEISKLRLKQGRPHFERIEYLKDTVRLGGGLDSRGALSEAAIERGLTSIRHFAAHIRDVPQENVRVVATQTLREATNRRVFLDAAEAALQVPIEVISGEEEARLIYAGVSHWLSDATGRRLVIDIGGRSTELIQGQGDIPVTAASYPLGCVSLSQRYFHDGKFSANAFDAALETAQECLSDAAEKFQATQWDVAYGSSGTLSAYMELLRAKGQTDMTVTSQRLAWCKEQLIATSPNDELHQHGLVDDRMSIIGGGIALLEALLQALRIQSLTPAKGALRHGVLCEISAQKLSQEVSLIS